VGQGVREGVGEGVVEGEESERERDTSDKEDDDLGRTPLECPHHIYCGHATSLTAATAAVSMCV